MFGNSNIYSNFKPALLYSIIWSETTLEILVWFFVEIFGWYLKIPYIWCSNVIKKFSGFLQNPQGIFLWGFFIYAWKSNIYSVYLGFNSNLITYKHDHRTINPTN